jgi:hypothetical protein
VFHYYRCCQILLTPAFSAFNLTYEDDKKKYGDPADTAYEIVQPVHANNEFANVIERHANATVNKKRRLED